MTEEPDTGPAGPEQTQEGRRRPRTGYPAFQGRLATLTALLHELAVGCDYEEWSIGPGEGFKHTGDHEKDARRLLWVFSPDVPDLLLPPSRDSTPDPLER